jgi:hypothetical protein
MRPTGLPRRLLLIASTLLVAGPPADAQEPVPLELSGRAFTLSDSLSSAGAGASVLSPDGRWIAATLSNRAGHQNLWIYPAGGGAPVRITSGAYRDVQPAGRLPGTASSSRRIARPDPLMRGSSP